VIKEFRKSEVFGSREWYELIGKTYRLRNPLLSKGLYGLRTLIKREYSLLPFSDLYFEIENEEELFSLHEHLSRTVEGPFNARCLIYNYYPGNVATYRVSVSTVEKRMSLMSNTTRRYTKQALKSGLQCKIGGKEDLDSFFKHHALTRNKQGLPVQPRKFFRNLLEKIPGATILSCNHENYGIIASFVLIVGKNTIYYKYGSSDPEFLDLRPNHYLFYSLHDFALDCAAKTIDLGRTDTLGLHQFKKSLGGKPLTIARLSNDGVVQEEASLRRESIIRRLLAAAPYQLSMLIGKFLYRYFA